MQVVHCMASVNKEQRVSASWFLRRLICASTRADMRQHPYVIRNQQHAKSSNIISETCRCLAWVCGRGWWWGRTTECPTTNSNTVTYHGARVYAACLRVTGTDT